MSGGAGDEPQAGVVAPEKFTVSYLAAASVEVMPAEGGAAVYRCLSGGEASHVVTGIFDMRARHCQRTPGGGCTHGIICLSSHTDARRHGCCGGVTDEPGVVRLAFRSGMIRYLLRGSQVFSSVAGFIFLI